MSSAYSSSNSKRALDLLVGRLVEARKRAGITQAAMVRHLHKKHQSQVSKIENGEHKLHLDDFVTWARVVGEDPIKLLQDFEDELQRRAPRHPRSPG